MTFRVPSEPTKHPFFNVRDPVEGHLTLKHVSSAHYPRDLDYFCGNFAANFITQPERSEKNFSRRPRRPSHTDKLIITLSGL